MIGSIVIICVKKLAGIRVFTMKYVKDGISAVRRLRDNWLREERGWFGQEKCSSLIYLEAHNANMDEGDGESGN